MTSRYTKPAIVLHWIIALMIAVNIALAFLSKTLEAATRQAVLDLHKSLGITILGLAIIRLTWRWHHRPPPLPAAYPFPERVAAHTAHALLYGLMLGLPLSGWIRDSAWKLASANPMKLYFAIPWPRIGPIMNLESSAKAAVHSYAGSVHAWLAYVLIALVILHVGAVVKHHAIDHDSVIKRMLI